VNLSFTHPKQYSTYKRRAMLKQILWLVYVILILKETVLM